MNLLTGRFTTYFSSTVRPPVLTVRFVTQPLPNRLTTTTPANPIADTPFQRINLMPPAISTGASDCQYLSHYAKWNDSEGIPKERLIEGIVAPFKESLKRTTQKENSSSIIRIVSNDFLAGRDAIIRSSLLLSAQVFNLSDSSFNNHK